MPSIEHIVEIVNPKIVNPKTKTHCHENYRNQRARGDVSRGGYDAEIIYILFKYS